MSSNPHAERAVLMSLRAAARSLPALVLLTAGCGAPGGGPTACDGLAGKTLAITRADYTKCAGEILDAMEDLEAPLRRYVDGDQAARAEARSAHQRLRHLMRQVDFQSDAWREVQGGAGRMIERWPAAGMREFNAEVVHAEVRFRFVLVRPDEESLQEGARRHAGARNAYARFR